MDKPVRKDIRPGNYDCSRNGAYFVTICTRDRKYLFWNNYDIDRVLRNKREYRGAWQYIESNPVNRENDELFSK